MKVAQRRDAARQERFHFRCNVYDASHPAGASVPGPSSLNLCGSPPTDYTLLKEYPFPTCPNGSGADADAYERMTLDEIFNGRPAGSSRAAFPGLVPLVEAYLNSIEVEPNVRMRLDRYLRLVSGRASGKLWTSATWQRDFIRSHPLYKHDSVVTDAIAYDLLKKVESITKSEEWPVEMFGELVPMAPHVPESQAAAAASKSEECTGCDKFS